MKVDIPSGNIPSTMVAVPIHLIKYLPIYLEDTLCYFFLRVMALICYLVK